MHFMVRYLYMEPSNNYGTVVQKPKWQLRWGHILLLLFFIVIIVIAYIVVHQIRTADKNSPTGTSSNHATTNEKNANSSKSSSSSSKPKSKSTANTGSQNKSTNTSGATTSGSSNNSTTLTNTGPGDTIGLFIGAAALSTLGHHLYTKRRLSTTE